MPLIFHSKEAESSSYFFRLYHNHIDIRKTFFHELQSLGENILNKCGNETVQLHLYSSKEFNFQQICSLLESAIEFTLKSERLNGSIL